MEIKKYHLLIFLMILSGCDPSESLDALLENATDSDLRIHFISAILLSEFIDNAEIINVESMDSQDYPRIGVAEGIGQAGLSLSVFDSIYISNNANEILKIYKPNSPGKNIYNIDQYWTVRETGKNHFEYTYMITDEDISN
ncbi:hypothetical protein CLV81_1431 [Flagellimonas meridianipacifica]|uniref:Lipoprotein n=2 Tax=Flagellimonas meridianipacifica TaxID=1080225 RepID=A0A2T0MIL5_9FLAO|nr:hypothetical protein CLV81_1431 [Allomuricauda pacifica]